MAAPKPAPAKAAETVPEPGTETVATPVEQDVAQANAEAATTAETVPAGDPRESALAALMYGQPEQPVTADTETPVDDSVVTDFGGRSKAVVLVSYYNQFVDGIVRQARKGDVIATDAESIKRGVKIKALRKLEG